MNYEEIELFELDLFLSFHQLRLFRFRIFPFRGVLL